MIAPWNYPIQLLVEPLAAALAAGNCVVAKPSELAPACSAALARLLPRYVDPDAVVVVEGGVPETTALLDQRWDHIFFTGSTAVGRVVAAAAAKHLTPDRRSSSAASRPPTCTRSADLDVAARRIAWGKFLNAGQTCIAPDYVLVDRQVRDQLVDKLPAHDRRVLRRRPEGQREPRPHRQRPPRSAACRASSTQGAGTVVTGGEVDVDDALRRAHHHASTRPRERRSCRRRSSARSCRCSPSTVPTRRRPSSRPARSRSPSTCSRRRTTSSTTVVDDVSSGGVCINQTLMHLLPADLPFGGVGDSGMGAYHGQAGFDAFSHHKSVLRKPTKPDLKLLYPPYKPSDREARPPHLEVAPPAPKRSLDS